MDIQLSDQVTGKVFSSIGCNLSTQVIEDLTQWTTVIGLRSEDERRPQAK